MTWRGFLSYEIVRRRVFIMRSLSESLCLDSQGLFLIAIKLSGAIGSFNVLPEAGQVSPGLWQ